ncbi:MAG: crotonase/enoyl-CoA hydratase family protein [Polaromonas sp.]|uniref:crotonase/enoyl-CoA hydratase family protein n=1 Tax=Polaromonas sp. TaxID=1869339 RepID=UPI0025ECE02C|nr:crotonase/enoyl-CoA hydratase family protein [Polaromonas sp.]MBI2726357.1 crotonase/enoyl-CoA hydratase family protein [Polaromonas sp.]
MSGQAVLYEVRGRVALITINRPEAMNAINMDVGTGLSEALRKFSADPELWAAVMTGAGDKAFSAGADLKAVAAGEMTRISEAGKPGIADLLRRYIDKPVIAAVNGYALGGGMEIALSCDLIVASEKAAFGLPEVRRGLVAAGGGMLRLPRQMPLKTAMYHVLTGEFMSAADALHWGLVNQLAPHDQVLEKAMELAERICANAPVAVRESKGVMYRSLDASLYLSDEAWAISDAAAARNRSSGDAAEGPRAFAEKRPPDWKGR